MPSAVTAPALPRDRLGFGGQTSHPVFQQVETSARCPGPQSFPALWPLASIPAQLGPQLAWLLMVEQWRAEVKGSTKEQECGGSSSVQGKLFLVPPLALPQAPLNSSTSPSPAPPSLTSPSAPLCVGDQAGFSLVPMNSFFLGLLTWPVNLLFV